MKKTYTLGATVVAALMALALSAQQANATVATWPITAKSYSVWFARAMDQCDPLSATLTITSPNLPGTGCLQADPPATVDDVLSLKWAHLLVSAATGKMVLLGTGMPFGGRVRVELDVRATTQAKAKQYSGLKFVTFETTTITCPNPTTNPYGFPVRPAGTISASASLKSCLGSSAFALMNHPSNLEILGARLINVDTCDPGPCKPFAEAGVVR